MNEINKPMAWIPVSEVFPQHQQRVIVWTQSALRQSWGGAYITKFHLTKDGPKWDIEQGNRWLPVSMLGIVTHWMPIIKPDAEKTP